MSEIKVILENSLELYLPFDFLDSSGTRLINQERVVREFAKQVIESLVKSTGGVTESQVVGYYLNKRTNKMFKIDTLLLSVSFNSNVCLDTAKYYAELFKEQFSQECIMLKCNGRTYMI